ncbi:MAG: uroporphyrinogen-III C-methyltransferase, partial [Pseudomonadota bacterium]
IGTEGTAPVLARRIKTDVEAMLSPRLGALAALSGSLRDAVAASIPRPKRRAFWAWVFGGAPALMHRAGDEAGATQLMEQAIAANGDLTTGTGGAIALVGAGPGARDLLTLRAVERLQEADVIFYDRLVDPEVLELARRDAERVYVGKTVGACAWPQAKISQLIVAEAKKGRRVVRLKSGDPAIFGRATEELEAARDQAIPVEIVPGVTAASAAAASFTASLTERGETDTLVVTTGTCRPGDRDPQWAHHVRAGATLAVYMGVSAAPRIAEEVMLAGAMPDTRVEVAVDVSKSSERRVTTTLGALAHDLETADVTGSAIILMKFRKSQIQVAAIAAE